MKSQALVIEPALVTARNLVSQLENGDTESAHASILDLTKHSESGLFEQVGRLTREVHDTFKAFCNDLRVAQLANQEIPDARERLHYVIELTEKSAHKTLAAIEAGIDVARQTGDAVEDIKVRWKKFRGRELRLSDFRQLSQDLAIFLEVTESHSATLKQGLSDALLAQDYQDLTGQILKGVIQMVGEVEQKLVEILAVAGSHNGGEAQRPARRPDQLEGPQLPGTQREDVLKNQDEVDDLLASLGF